MSASDTYTPASDPLQGRVIAGKYKLLHKLGEGAMGSVYLAEHLGFKEPRAIKIIREHLAKDPKVRQRFLDEVQITRKASLETDHIVSIYDDFGFEEGIGYYVMEHLEGEVLSERIKRENPLPIPWVVRVATEICEAMEAAHNLGIIFRDLKPDNIFLIKHRYQEDFVKVIDFGIAKSNEFQTKNTQSGHISGTPLYMSPEQIRGPSKEQQKSGELHLDARTDIYSLGCVIYEMLTGKPPFYIDGWNSAMDMLVIFQQHLTMTPASLVEARPDIPPALEKCVMKALEKDRENRFQSMAEFSKELLLSIATPEEEQFDIVESEPTILQPYEETRIDVNISQEMATSDSVGLEEAAVILRDNDDFSASLPTTHDHEFPTWEEDFFGVTPNERTMINEEFSETDEEADTLIPTQDALPEINLQPPTYENEHLPTSIVEELEKLSALEIPSTPSLTERDSHSFAPHPLAKTPLTKSPSSTSSHLKTSSSIAHKTTPTPSAPLGNEPLLAITAIPEERLQTPPPISLPSSSLNSPPTSSAKNTIFWWSLLLILGFLLVLISLSFFFFRQPASAPKPHLTIQKRTLPKKASLQHSPKHSDFVITANKQHLSTVTANKQHPSPRHSFHRPPNEKPSHSFPPSIRKNSTPPERKRKKFLTRCPRKTKKYRWLIVYFRKTSSWAFLFDSDRGKVRLRHRRRRYLCLGVHPDANILYVRSQKDPYRYYSCEIKLFPRMRKLRIKKLIPKTEPLPDQADYCKF